MPSKLIGPVAVLACLTAASAAWGQGKTREALDTTLTISGVNVRQVKAGSKGFVLVVSGRNFRTSAFVRWSRNGVIQTLTTRVLYENVITADVPDSLLARAGSIEISVGQNKASSFAGIPGPNAIRQGLFDELLFNVFFSPIFVDVAQLVTFEFSNELPFTIEGVEITTACPLPAGTQGVPYKGELTANGANPIAWSIVNGFGNLPPGLSISGLAVAGTPTQSGNFGFILRATDAALNTATQECSMTIAAPPPPPPPPPGVLTVNCPAPTAVRNQMYNSAVSATGASPGTITFSIMSGSLPAGLQLSGVTVSGTPTATGLSTFRLRANSPSASGMRDCSISVSQTPPPPPPDVVAPLGDGNPIRIGTACPLPSGRVATQYRVDLAAEGGPGPPFTWSLAGGSLPPGLTLRAGGFIEGFPGFGGDYGFILRASSGNQSATRSCSMTVAGPGGLLTILRITPPAATMGTGPVAALIEGTGYQAGMRLVWQPEDIEPLELPVSAPNSEQAIVSFPRELLSEPGRYQVALRAPGNPPRFSNSVLFNVVPALELSQACPFPAVLPGARYRQKIEARGGFPPYRFTVANRRLPNGLSIEGEEIAGSTEEEGVFEFLLVVTDAARNTAARNCSIRVPGGIDADPKVVSFSMQFEGRLPPSQEVSVFSVTPGVGFRVTAATLSGGNWLRADLTQGATPALLRVSAADAPAGEHQGEIVLTPDNGTAPVKIQVLFLVRPPPEDRLTGAPGSILFTSVQAGPRPQAQIVDVFNQGAAPVSYRGSITYLNGADWLEATPVTGEVTNRRRVRMRLAARTQELEPGTYRALLRLDPNVGPPVLIPVTLAVSAASERMVLSTEGASFRAAAGRPFLLSQRYQVLARGGNGFRWKASAETFAGGNWLRSFPDEGESTPDASSGADILVDAQGLEAGEYHGEITVEAEGVGNAPRKIWVVLQLTSGGIPAPGIRPGALAFTIAPGGTGLARQRVVVQNLAAENVSVDFALQGDARAFRATGPESRSVAPGQSMNIDVEAVTAGLAAGVYRGALGIRLSNEARVRLVDLTLIVAPGATATPRASGRQAAGCSPTRLVPQSNVQPLGFTAPGGLPLPLEVRVLDDCGDMLTEGAVTVAFSNGAPAPISLSHVGGGRWSGTWPVQQTTGAAVTLSIAAENGSRELAGAIEIGGGVTPSDQAPVIFDRGITSSATGLEGRPLALGSIIRVSGLRLVDAAESAAPPLPGTLGNARLIIGGRETPLSFAGGDALGTALIGVLPFTLQPNVPYQATVRRGNRRSNFVEIVPAAVQPAVFTVDRAAGGQGLAYAGTEAVVVADRENPVARGERLQIVMEGLGAVTPQIAAGQEGPQQPLAEVIAPVTVTIGGVPAEVQGAVLAPRQAGLYVVGVIVPTTIEPGEAVPVQVTVGGVTSEAVTVAVK